jgi:hypothetical protein
MATSHPTFDPEDRLQGLQRRIRHLQIALVVLLVLWAFTSAVGLKAAAVPQSVDAQQFRVLDAHGQPQAVLRGGPQGAELVFLGPHGKQTMVISDKVQLIPAK